MARTDIYLKVSVEHDLDEAPEKLANEICRQISRVYGVRSAEMSSFITRSTEDAG